MSGAEKIIETVKFNDDGLVPAIVQDSKTNEVLMMAWMNADALRESINNNRMYYFSRSRNRLWKKGETSGQIQKIIELRLDCDNDTILAIVEQEGVACHTGRKSCFFKTVDNDNIKINQDVVTPPEELYNE
ncbi:MAG: phosphoribosyl-AMP cyclohydrolase [Rickettsiales bacterium]|nr:phosphoribosyl-AMP cyclohydrolase [Pseudomonadota bacterium]MDA0966830.1 phosphoribosyl-AMP cyclohydrolase [Pseudomonadota bacterium]MDG4543504.1 phosphoribosyl-AMP cyclohydrolase [Rickettsiales bacterium]MDG4546102.1 phosphoribosyl-AMP cyclohydrolase [Rickettsiales bacterium]MDG4547575.1 phosphoribosyl-AMP cyclohydrolase [Rickettsiales bacterium]